jgi:iron(III) transport system substrate-binding protein
MDRVQRSLASATGTAGGAVPQRRHHGLAPKTPRPGRLLGRAAAGLVALTVGAASLAACGGSSGGTAGALTLYNGQHEQTTDALVAAFEKATGIKVNVRNDNEDTLADDIVGEGGRSPADVIYSENSPALEYLQERHLLAPVDSSTLSRTPSKYDSPEGDWVGVSARVSVLIYNPKLIAKSALPTTALALADPKYRGKLALAAGETDFQPIVTSMARTYGTAAALKWLEGLKANAGGQVYPDNESVSNQVNRGTVAFGVVDQYYWYRMGAQLGASNLHSQIAHFAPGDPGYVVDVSGAAILASSRHQAAAQRFVAFLVSAPGQRIIDHSYSYEYPIASGVTTTQPETPLAQLQPNSIGVAQLGDGSTAISLLKQAGLL